MGRTKHDLQTVLVAVEKGITVTGTANLLKCTRQTVLNYRRRWKVVDRAIMDKRRELVDLSEMALRGAVLRGEPWAVAFALRTLGKNDGYTERQEVTGPDGAALELRVTYGDDRPTPPAAAPVAVRGEETPGQT